MPQLSHVLQQNVNFCRNETFSCFVWLKTSIITFLFLNCELNCVSMKRKSSVRLNFHSSSEDFLKTFSKGGKERRREGWKLIKRLPETFLLSNGDVGLINWKLKLFNETKNTPTVFETTNKTDLSNTQVSTALSSLQL